MRTSAALIAATALALCSPPTARAQVATAAKAEGAGAKDVAPCPSGYVARLSDEAGASGASTSSARVGGASPPATSSFPGAGASTAPPSASAYNCVLSTIATPRRSRARSQAAAADYKAPSLFGDGARAPRPVRKGTTRAPERHATDYGLAGSSGYGARDVAGYGAKQTGGYGPGQVNGYGRSESMSIDDGRSENARTSSPQAPGL
jgi:hypothetical protein